MKIVEIGVVLVTYNRLEKLKTALASFERQSLAPAYLIVVDNASTDGTSDYLASWEKEPGRFQRIVLSKTENTGGSGGFCAGLKAALEYSAPWIWVSDDDAFPEEETLKTAAKYLSENQWADQPSAICGAVINHGEVDLEHRRRIRPGRFGIKEESVRLEEYAEESFQLNGFSYVGVILNREKLRQVGLTREDYFLWYDDTEHSLRLSRTGPVYCVPGIRIHHDVPPAQGGVSWKNYYGIRNMITTYKEHFPKRHALYVSLRLVLKAAAGCLLGKNKKWNRMAFHGVADAWTGKMGLHPVYRPGWETKK